MIRFVLLTFLVLCQLQMVARAEGIGVSLGGQGRTLDALRKGIEQAAQDQSLALRLELAPRDAELQLEQVRAFVAQGVQALIIQPADPRETESITQLARDASIPLVYVNKEPRAQEQLGGQIVYVGANETESGTLIAQEACRRLTELGKNPAQLLVMTGDLSSSIASIRSRSLKDVIGRRDCDHLKVLDEQTAVGDRDKGQDLMSNWLIAGFWPDAIIAHNDDMALGAIAAYKARGFLLSSIVVYGVDATPDAIAAVKAGELAATVYQDAYGQGIESVRTTSSLLRGEAIPPKTYTPTRLITSVNADYVIVPN